MANNTEQSLKDEIWAIKYRSKRIFHNNHNDGDIAVLNAIEEMTKLLEAEATRRAISELEHVKRSDNVNNTLSGYGRVELEERIAELKRQAEGEK